VNFLYESNRVYLENENHHMIAEVTFPEVQEGVVEINHTFVDDCLRGQGVASQLLQHAVEQIEKQGKKVIPTCSYAVSWFAKHPQWNHLLKQDNL
jgi:predicted GNAT family acetyltransferase